MGVLTALVMQAVQIQVKPHAESKSARGCQTKRYPACFSLSFNMAGISAAAHASRLS